MIVKQLNSRLMDQLRLTRDNFANVLIDEYTIRNSYH